MSMQNIHNTFCQYPDGVSYLPYNPFAVIQSNVGDFLEFSEIGDSFGHPELEHNLCMRGNSQNNPEMVDYNRTDMP